MTSADRWELEQRVAAREAKEAATKPASVADAIRNAVDESHARATCPTCAGSGIMSGGDNLTAQEMRSYPHGRTCDECWGKGVTARKDGLVELMPGILMAPYDACTRASDPYVAPNPDLTDALAASIAHQQTHCVTCGDLLSDDFDNFTRTVGMNKPGRIDCGRCVRGMRKVGTS